MGDVYSKHSTYNIVAVEAQGTGDGLRGDYIVDRAENDSKNKSVIK